MWDWGLGRAFQHKTQSAHHNYRYSICVCVFDEWLERIKSMTAITYGGERAGTASSLLSIVILRTDRHTLSRCNILITSSTSWRGTTTQKNSWIFSVGEEDFFFFCFLKRRRKYLWNRITHTRWNLFSTQIWNLRNEIKKKTTGHEPNRWKKDIIPFVSFLKYFFE
jgi:hypothetical protein